MEGRQHICTNSSAPRPAVAQNLHMSTIAKAISDIADGRCMNQSLCRPRFGMPNGGGGFGRP
jgi:hypothetical protein